MRNNIILVFLGLIMCSLIFYRFFYKNEISYSVENDIVDVGTTISNKTSLAVFKITNLGKDFKITGIKADCHCTVPNWNKKTIKKGETSEIEVIYDNHNIGYFEQTLYVYFDESEKPSQLLIMRGKVVKPVNKQGL